MRPNKVYQIGSGGEFIGTVEITAMPGYPLAQPELLSISVFARRDVSKYQKIRMVFGDFIRKYPDGRSLTIPWGGTAILSAGEAMPLLGTFEGSESPIATLVEDDISAPSLPSPTDLRVITGSISDGATPIIVTMGDALLPAGLVVLAVDYAMQTPVGWPRPVGTLSSQRTVSSGTAITLFAPEIGALRAAGALA